MGARHRCKGNGRVGVTADPSKVDSGGRSGARGGLKGFRSRGRAEV